MAKKIKSNYSITSLRCFDSENFVYFALTVDLLKVVFLLGPTLSMNITTKNIRYREKFFFCIQLAAKKLNADLFEGIL